MDVDQPADSALVRLLNGVPEVGASVRRQITIIGSQACPGGILEFIGQPSPHVPCQEHTGKDIYLYAGTVSSAMN